MPKIAPNSLKRLKNSLINRFIKLLARLFGGSFGVNLGKGPELANFEQKAMDYSPWFLLNIGQFRTLAVSHQKYAPNSL